MHWIRNKKHGHDSFAAAKLDMSKASDRVEWKFLRAMLVILRFPLPLIDLVMQCIGTVEFSFVINSKVYGSIIPSRGLRQGCPLSHFLFVVCAHGFSSLLRHFENQDDSLIFLKANEQTADHLGNVFKIYEKASGQIINYEKSAISFSPNATEDVIEKVTASLGIIETAGHAVYLGLPTFIPRQKKLHFDYLRDRVAKKFRSWDHKLFSAGGKETLIKSVIQSIPTYTMSCFRIPVGVCSDIERECARFWWGDTADARKLYWAKWSHLCQPKASGGLGFRQLIPFNQALLAK
ncbi:uncharacterized protein LOC131023552 [Salvia miltiorrhiza]|uniref:uncharacterized protein LOC131023552 n=1 Tax=Salvia miltiorrhiza TaxID=226208 RepID=UPI0025AD31EF|nr:uncharacterized protein LOC131023552 [Salvia miltiorrhiza]